MRYLKQSTAVDVGIGPFVDDTDGKTAETALTITQADVRLKKGAGNWAQKAAAQTLTHEENGWYELTLDATDTDTIGHLLVAIHESGALPVWQEFHVLAANVYEALFGAATDKLDVNVEEWDTIAVPALTGAGNIKADVLALNGNTTSPVILDRSVRSMIRFTVGSSSTTTSIVTSSLDPAPSVTDQFKGRVAIFDGTTITAALRGQAGDIAASTAGGVVTVSTLTTAPVTGDTGVIV